MGLAALEVDQVPAGPVAGGYVRSDLADGLVQIAAAMGPGNGRLVLVVGEPAAATAGACRQALARLADSWRLVWSPVDVGELVTGLHGQGSVGPQPWTVIWLQSAQRYLVPDDPELAEEVAATLRGALHRPDGGPLLILGTVTVDPRRWHRLLQPPASGGRDLWAQTRALLQVASLVPAGPAVVSRSRGGLREPGPAVEAGAWPTAMDSVRPGAVAPVASRVEAADTGAPEATETAATETAATETAATETAATETEAGAAVAVEPQAPGGRSLAEPEALAPEGSSHTQAPPPASVGDAGTADEAWPEVGQDDMLADADESDALLDVGDAGLAVPGDMLPGAEEIRARLMGAGIASLGSLPPGPVVDALPQTAEGVRELAEAWERDGNLSGAERLYEIAAMSGDLHALAELSRIRRSPDALRDMAQLYTQAVKERNVAALFSLAAAGHGGAVRALRRILAARARPPRRRPG